jgi:hypothetical protein
MNMKNSALAGLLMAATLTCAPSYAQDSSLRVRAGFAGVGYVQPDSSGKDIESMYGAAQVGASYVTAGGWYGDLAVRTSLAAKWNTGDIIAGAKDDDFSRTETTLTIGKGFGDGLAVFAGVQVASSELTLSKANTGRPADGSITIDDTIVFAGLSASYPAGPGSVSLSGALGILTEEQTVSPGLPGAGTYKADPGAGLSLGAAYSHPVTKALSILADIRMQFYSVKYPNLQAQSNQTLVSMGVSIVGQF